MFFQIGGKQGAATLAAQAKDVIDRNLRDAQAIKDNAKKIMEARFQEEHLRQQQASADKCIDVFHGFDSIDQMTALLLYNNGYTSVERLLAATLDDLMRIGIKKKIAHLICNETKDFIKWKVRDAEEQHEQASSSADEV